MLSRTFLPAGIALLSLLTAGCDKSDQEIQVYRVSKAEAEPSSPPAGPAIGQSPAMPGVNAPNAPAQEVIGTPPASWVAQPPSSMRLASYQIKGADGAVADISLIALGGAAGGALENVNRWLSQLGQPPMDQARLDGMARRIPAALGEALAVDLQGLPTGADPKKDGRIDAAIGRWASNPWTTRV